MQKTIILCVGVPCSGKSTWVDKMLKESYKATNIKEGNYFIRISRDNIRKSLTGLGNTEYWTANKLGAVVEASVIDMEIFQLERAFELGLNIIVDDTHSQIYDLENIIQRAESHDYRIKIKIFDIDFLTAKKRILERDGERFLHFMSGYERRIKVVKEHILEFHKEKIVNE